MITGRWRLAVGAAILSACVVVPATAHADATCAWSETVLPQPQGMTVTDVLSSDPAGRWLVGTSEQNKSYTAVVWRDGAVSRTLPFADTSTATDVNDDGVVTTRSWTSGKAFKHLPDGQVEELPALPGAAVTYPENINSAGDVVGMSGGKYVSSVVVWRAGTVESLPLSNDALIWKTVGIDDDGHVAAYGYTSGDGIDAYVWDRDHVRVQLQPLPGHRAAFPHTIRNGRVLGQSSVDSGSAGILVEWDLTGRIVRTFDDYGFALSVNSSGHVLGLFAARGSDYGVWRAADDFRPLPEGVRPSVLSEDGDVSGMRYDREQQRSVPVHLRCA